jgi:hypothetical protein
MTSAEILDISMDPNKPDAPTIRGYFIAILTELWQQPGTFSGKRPLGNGNWRIRMYTALIVAGAMKGEFDDEGYADWDNNAEQEADKLILAAIQAL